MTWLPPVLIAAAALLLAAFVSSGRRQSRTYPSARSTAVAVRTPSVPKRQMRRDVPHALYCYTHRFGGAVYIGISNDPEERHRRRWAEFKAGNPRVAWLAESTGEMTIISWYPDWATARAAEDELIARFALEGHPVANDQGNPLRRSRRAA